MNSPLRPRASIPCRRAGAGAAQPPPGAGAKGPVGFYHGPAGGGTSRDQWRRANPAWPATGPLWSFVLARWRSGKARPPAVDCGSPAEWVSAAKDLLAPAHPIHRWKRSGRSGGEGCVGTGSAGGSKSFIACSRPEWTGRKCGNWKRWRGLKNVLAVDMITAPTCWS